MDTRPTPDELRRLYVDELKSLAEIARPYGVSAALVRKWLLRAGIPTRTKAEARAIAKKPSYTEEQIEDMRVRAANARASISGESRQKQSETRKRLGLGGHNKGVPWTPEEREAHMAVRRTPQYKANLSASLSGEKNYNWRGGHESRSPRGWQWREIRQQVYERDKWLCQECGIRCLNTRDSKKYPKRKIQCHHIIRRRDGGADTPENLITLCMSCHHKRERRSADRLFA